MAQRLRLDILQVTFVLVEDGRRRTWLGRRTRPVLGPEPVLGRRLTAGSVIRDTADVLVERKAGRDVLVDRLGYELLVADIFQQRELRTMLGRRLHRSCTHHAKLTSVG